MLFLLNDVLLTLRPGAVTPPPAGMLYANLETITQLGRELFSEDPNLPRNKPLRAEKLATLILMRNPTINAALFMAPQAGCKPAQVQFRYAELSLDVIGGILKRQTEGSLSAAKVDEMVWRRIPAAA